MPSVTSFIFMLYLVYNFNNNKIIISTCCYSWPRISALQWTRNNGGTFDTIHKLSTVPHSSQDYCKTLPPTEPSTRKKSFKGWQTEPDVDAHNVFSAFCCKTPKFHVIFTRQTKTL